MPLMKGHSPQVVSSNVKELMKAGHPQKQAIAIALSSKRKFKKMADGGLVNSDFDEAGTPRAISSGDEDSYRSSHPSAAHELQMSSESDEESRDLAELNADGAYCPEEVASPMEQDEAKSFAMAMKRQSYAMGGLVDDPGEEHDLLGSKPSEEMQDGVEEKGADLMSSEAELEHSVLSSNTAMSPKPPKDYGLSEEAMEAIRQRKMKRRYPIV